MKILHYIHSIDKSYGGVSAYLQLLSKNLGLLEDVHIATHHTTNELPIYNCCVHYLEGNIYEPYKLKRSFIKLLDTINPEIVHINGCWLPQYSWTVFWAKSKGCKVIITPHGMLEPWDIKKNYWTRKLPALLLYQRKAIKQADALIATSESEKANLVALEYNKNIKIVPNGIDIDEVPFRLSWEEKKQILFLALLRKNKGVDLLLEAISLIKRFLIGWQVIIAGLPYDYNLSDINKMSKDLGISEMVKVVGGVFGDEKWHLYKTCDLFVLPTLNENFGIVIAEALLCGTPVITTKGAPWPQLEEEKCGWWVDRDVDSIATAILEFQRLDINSRKEMGIRGRKFVIKNYSSEMIAQKMASVYRSIL